MLRMKSERVANIRFPILHRLIRKAEHQVETNIRDTILSKDIHGLVYLCSRMATVKEMQTVTRESLRTHGDTVHGQVFEHPLDDIIRVALHRHFSIAVDIIHIIYMYKQLLQALMRKLARCASAQIDGTYLGFIKQQFHLLAQRIDVALAQRQ